MKPMTHFLIAACAAASVCVTAAPAQEAKTSTPYYEKDAWYDVSEWFDGNNYNPTDEALGRWDDETFTFSDAASSGDRDNPRGNRATSYGNNTGGADSDRWFYDYYDDGFLGWFDRNKDGIHDGYTYYYDRNSDGLYDAYSYYFDRNNDGVFEDAGYYSFGVDTAADAGKQTAAAQKSSKPQQITGTIENVKNVQVRGNKHVLAQVKTDDGKTVHVDLGANAAAPSKNDKLQARGPSVTLGDKNLIVASSATVEGKELNIQRDGRRFEGKVESTREVTVRGQKHLLAKINTKDNKKLLVDLGPAEKLSSKPDNGEQLTVSGVPVKMNNRVMLMARSVTMDGQRAQIERQPDRASASNE